MATTTESDALKSFIHPADSGIRIRPTINAHKGSAYGVSYLVDVPQQLTGGRRIRIQRSSLKAAKTEAERQYKGAQRLGEGFFFLSPQDRAEVVDWLPRLKEAGISFKDAAEFAITHLAGTNSSITTAQFIEDYTKSKKERLDRGDLRPRSFKDFKARADRFAEEFGEIAIIDLTAEKIRSWLLEMKVSPRTTKNYLAIISEILNEAVSKGIIAQSPLVRISRHERKVLCGTTEESEPGVLSITEAKKLLTTAKQTQSDLGLLPCIVLGLFCGLRTEEIKRLDWSSINLDGESPSVTISKEIAKKRRIRHVDIPANAVLWLKGHKDEEGLVVPHKNNIEYERRFRELTRLSQFGSYEKVPTKAGMKKRWISTWKINAMRHSFGSYHYALHGDPMLTSRLLGHKSNDTVLFDHYRALASKEDAEKYFELKPEQA